jgi:hypothetical protein
MILNEKIDTILDNLEVDGEPGGGGWINTKSKKEAANDLEKLFLQCQIDLLNDFLGDNNLSRLVESDFKKLISELTQQLKKLTEKQ